MRAHLPFIARGLASGKGALFVLYMLAQNFRCSLMTIYNKGFRHILDKKEQAIRRSRSTKESSLTPGGHGCAKNPVRDLAALAVLSKGAGVA